MLELAPFCFDFHFGAGQEYSFKYFYSVNTWKSVYSLAVIYVNLTEGTEGNFLGDYKDLIQFRIKLSHRKLFI